MRTTLLELLKDEKTNQLKGGLYHTIQIKLAYNTNQIESCKLFEGQTRYIYETNTFASKDTEATNVDDIIKTVNHFHCFDYMLDIANQPLFEIHKKKFHKILKTNTLDAKKDWFNIGEYKSKPNIVGGQETTHPNHVKKDMDKLLGNYKKKKIINIFDIIEFHYHFECIHPFQDGDGRVGRLLLFKECLQFNIVPFIIEDCYKFFYYRGLSEYLNVKAYLTDTCLSAQDNYKAILSYFEIDI